MTDLQRTRPTCICGRPGCTRHAAVSSHGIVLDSEGVRCAGCAALTDRVYCDACRRELVTA